MTLIKWILQEEEIRGAEKFLSVIIYWNNNYANDNEKCVLFHCGNWAKSFLPDIEISTAPILGTTVGEENTYGALAGRTPASPLTFVRISTDNAKGIMKLMWEKECDR